MNMDGAAVFFFVLLTILGHVLANDDVCQGKKVEQLVRYLGDEHLKKIEDRLESKLMFKQLTNCDSKTSAISEEILKVSMQVKEMDEIELSLASVREQVQQVADAVAKTEETPKTLEKVQRQAEENANAIKTISKCLQFMLLQNQLRVVPSQFFNILGRIFHYDATKMEWKAAKEMCERQGMQMATLKTVSELQQVAQQIVQRNTHALVWLSASDIGGTSGHFRWSDGTRVDGSVWGSGQPDEARAGHETCAVMHTWDAKLHDLICSGTRGVLCHVPLLPTTSCF